MKFMEFWKEVKCNWATLILVGHLNLSCYLKNDFWDGVGWPGPPIFHLIYIHVCLELYSLFFPFTWSTNKIVWKNSRQMISKYFQLNIMSLCVI